MESIEKPEKWDNMSYGEKLIWIFKKQQKLEENIKSF